jgi:hypothetical protein
LTAAATTLEPVLSAKFWAKTFACVKLSLKLKLSLLTFVWFEVFVWLKYTGIKVETTNMLTMTATVTTAIKTMIGVEIRLFEAGFTGGTGAKVTTSIPHF